jgi:acyl-CoA synthetase (NDP forming)/RimJ/RimL family protein N-acetyltransferase
MTALDLEAYTQDVALSDGRTIHIRPIRADDLSRMLELWDRLSPDTIRRRFFAPRRMDARQMRYFTELDYEQRFALVAETGGRIVGVARFDRYPDDPSTAEFAVLIEDAEQGRGIGTALLRALVEPALDLGVRRFVGEVLRENSAMLGVLQRAGLEPVLRGAGSIVNATFETVSTETFLATGDERDRKAAIAALTKVFKPASIAVAGASRDPSSAGGAIFRNLLRYGFEGPVYPVNPATAVVQSVAAYRSLGDCPGVPELVVVATPPDQVAGVVEEAAKLGSAAAVVITQGFREAGDDGAERERELMDVARTHGIRVVGPNTIGVLNAAAGTRMNATFASRMPPPGRVAFSSESGALGLTVLAAADRLGLGLSSFVSIGNRADISGNDLLQYWESDPDTDVVLLYLESFGNPQKFGRIARRVGRRKPIVAVMPGRGEGHEDRTVEALFRQAGVIRTATLDELFGVTSVLANQPLPNGNRVGVVAVGDGLGLLGANACEANGLTVPPLDQIDNPLDLPSSSSPDRYAEALRTFAQDPKVDAVLTIFIPPVKASPRAVANEIAAVASDTDVPIVSVFTSEQGIPEALAEARVPSFRFPEGAAQALGHVTRYAAWRRAPQGHIVRLDDVDPDAARAVVDEAMSGADRGARVMLSAEQACRLLAAYGVTMAPSRIVHSPAEAADAARAIGDGPFAVKAAAPVPKTPLRAVHLDLAFPDEVAAAVLDLDAELRRRRRDDIADQGWIVQQMVSEGREMLVGVRHDPTFGQIHVLSMGGDLFELMDDTTVRLHPLTDVDAREMVAELRGAPLLVGYRGSTPLDVQALRTLLLRMNALVEAVPEIDFLHLDPVFVQRHGVTCVDVRVRLAHHRRIRG